MDRHTLFSLLGGLQIFMGLVVYLAWRGQRRTTGDRGAVWFSIGFVVGGVGLMLQSYRGTAPDYVTILLGNALYLMTYIFMERALAITTGRRSCMYVLVAMDLALTANYAYFTYVRPDVVLRTVEAVVTIPLFQLPIWLHLRRSQDLTIRPALRTMWWILTVHLAVNFIRVIGVMLLHHPDAWYSWLGVMTVVGVALSYLWIDWLRMREELERHALTDPLTGLLNRRGLEEVARRELSRASRAGSPCSALTIDVNRFKQINDTYGHAAGDRALRAVAEALTGTLRGSDVATRVGGDEFFVLLPDTDERAAGEVSLRLRRAIEQRTIESVAGRGFQMTVSIGAVTSHGERTLDELFHSSDMKLYDEKKADPGRKERELPAETAMPHLSNA